MIGNTPFDGGQDGVLAAIVEALPTGILLMDGLDNVVFHNRRFFEIWGFDIPQDSKSKGLFLIEETRKRVADPDTFIKIFHRYMESSNLLLKGTDTIHLNDGRSLERYTAPVFDRTGTHYGRVFYFYDVTDRLRAEHEIRSLAFQDALTKLPNRRILYDRLSSAMASGRRQDHYSALILIDLDNFKPLNDGYGHDVGDALLIEIAQRLTGCVRDTDTISRLGGDEFVVLLPELGGTLEIAASDSQSVAEKIRDRLSAPVHIADHDGGTDGDIIHRPSASIGVTVFKGDSRNHAAILRSADRAMYRAKADGGNTIRLAADL